MNEIKTEIDKHNQEKQQIQEICIDELGISHDTVLKTNAMLHYLSSYILSLSNAYGSEPENVKEIFKCIRLNVESEISRTLNILEQYPLNVLDMQDKILSYQDEPKEQ